MSTQATSDWIQNGPKVRKPIGPVLAEGVNREYVVLTWDVEGKTFNCADAGYCYYDREITRFAIINDPLIVEYRSAPDFAGMFHAGNLDAALGLARGLSAKLSLTDIKITRDGEIVLEGEKLAVMIERYRNSLQEST